VSQRSTGPHKPGPSGATPEPAIRTTRYANWQSGEVESLVFVGSTPTLVTIDRVVQRQRRLVDFQESMVQLHPRSLALTRWGVGPTGRRLACNQEIGVRLPDAPLAGSCSNGTTLARQASPVLSETPWVQFPVGPLTWKAAGYGSPGRFAKPCGAAKRRVGSTPTPSARAEQDKLARW
jgi:hypothetical protein